MQQRETLTNASGTPASGTNERLRLARRFWDDQAEWNIHRAILDHGDAIDPDERDTAFAAAGIGDAFFLSRFLDPEMRVVDLGCGIGRVMLPVSHLVRELVGFDISEKMLAEAAAYLKGAKNTRVLHTPGSQLPGVDDGSVDALYSFLCLIHVDKRNAYRYMREISRVLRKDGIAILQFENILSPEGLAELQRVLAMEREYPLEFYSEAEAAYLLGSVGLDVLYTSCVQQFLYVVAVKGSAREWVEAIRRDVLVARFDKSGSLAAEEMDLSTPGKVEIELLSRLDTPRTFVAGLALRRADTHEYYFTSEASVVLGPGQHLVEVEYLGPTDVRVLVDGERPLPQDTRIGKARGPAEADLGMALMPIGFPENALSKELLGDFGHQRRVRVRAE